MIILSIASLPSAQDYMVGEGDVLRITVYDNPDLTTVARVTGEGDIIFPLIGQVKVGGLVISEIANRISEMLADGYIINPQVSVFIEEYRSKKTVIMGQVEKPGLYVLHGQTTFLELLSKAGGLAKDAGETAIIKRKSEQAVSNENRIEVDLKRLIEEGDLTYDVPIMDGDSVYVSKAGVFYVTGEVQDSGAFKHGKDITVVKAISMAGGLTEKAAPGRVRIMRKVNDHEEIIEKVKMDEPILPNDVIVVPESFF